MRETVIGLIGCVVFVVSIPGPCSSQALPRTPASDQAAVVRDREIAFARAMADRDLEAFASFVSDEAVFFSGNQAIRGRAAVVEAWAPFFDGPLPPFSWAPEIVEVLESGRLALSSGPVTAANGEAAGRFNSVWRLEPDGVWRVVFDKGS